MKTLERYTGTGRQAAGVARIGKSFSVIASIHRSATEWQSQRGTAVTGSRGEELESD